MKFYISALVAATCTLLVSQPVVALPKVSIRSINSNPTTAFSIRAAGVKVECAIPKDGIYHVPGRFEARARGKFVPLARELAARRKQLRKLQSPADRRAARNLIAKLDKRFRLAEPLCASGPLTIISQTLSAEAGASITAGIIHSGDSETSCEVTATSAGIELVALSGCQVTVRQQDPTINEGELQVVARRSASQQVSAPGTIRMIWSPLPVADHTVVGDGGLPVQIALASGRPDGLFCEILNAPPTVVVDDANDCNPTVRAIDGQLSEVSFQYRLFRPGTNYRSTTGTVTVRWEALRAFSGSYVGAGINPIAIQMNHSGNDGVSCQILDHSAGVSVENVSGCTALVRPLNHVEGVETLQFTATRGTNGHRSLPATLSLTWDQSGDFIGDVHSLGSYRSNLTVAEARHLARQVGLGMDVQEMVALATGPNGLQRALDRYLTRQDREQCASIEADAQALANFSQNVFCQSFPVTINGISRNVNYCAPNTAQNRVQSNTAAAGQFWIGMLRYGCDPLRERLGLLWHNHFAVNLASYQGSNGDRNDYITHQIARFRSDDGSEGNRLLTPFDTLLSKFHGEDGAMLRWLNNDANAYGVAGGNENYARELMELFSLGSTDIVTGALNYTEQHIYAMRFALMGYTDSGAAGRASVATVTGTCTPDSMPEYCNSQPSRLIERFVVTPYFDNNRWNAQNQPARTTLFEGMPFAQIDAWKANTLTNGQDLLTPYLTRQHPGVARYIAARLLATFVSKDLTNEMVQQVADTLRSNNFELEPALRLILSSSAFFAPEHRHDGVSSPVESFTTFTRAMNLPITRFTYGSSVINLAETLRVAIINSGYPLLEMPSVFGVPEDGKITGGRIHAGIGFATQQRFLERQRGIISYFNTINTARANGYSFSWASVFSQGQVPASPGQIVDELAGRLALDLTPTERGHLLGYLTTMTTATTTVNGIVTADPNRMYPINWGTLSEAQRAQLWEQKGPGLLTLLFGTYDYLTR